MAAAGRLILQGAGAMTGAFSLLKRLIFGAALAWLATPLAAFADDAPQLGAPELDNKQIEILYTAPQASYLKPLYDRLRQRQFLEQLKEFLSPLNIPPCA